MALLIRNDRNRIHQLRRMNETFKDPSREKPDTAGAENVTLLNQMYQSMAKAEKET